MLTRVSKFLEKKYWYFRILMYLDFLTYWKFFSSIFQIGAKTRIKYQTIQLYYGRTWFRGILTNYLFSCLDLDHSVNLHMLKCDLNTCPEFKGHLLVLCEQPMPQAVHVRGSTCECEADISVRPLHERYAAIVVGVYRLKHNLKFSQRHWRLGNF